MNFTVRTKKDLVDAVKRFGILPYFENSLSGFSIEEHCAPSAWFSGVEGVWEWKGPVIKEAKCAYGKFFEKKAAFVSREWFLDLANYRRDGYDYDARYEDGLAAYRDKELYDLIEKNAPMLSKELKRIGNYKKGGKKGFDTIVNRLQFQGYVIIDDFVYMTDRLGNEYGWGVAKYTTPETFFGKSFAGKVYRRTPEASYERLFKHLKELLPRESEDAIRRFLG
ncbi:MAG: hypothetical protein IJQ12_00750 [Lachnospiraceae bacterium]|nr:hypothetical protein [Lachnospiraceae bacterium]